MKTTIAFFIIINISLLLHKNQTYWVVTTKTVAEKVCKRCYIFDAASNTFFNHNR
jgi:hypothetical protein